MFFKRLLPPFYLILLWKLKNLGQPGTLKIYLLWLQPHTYLDVVIMQKTFKTVRNKFNMFIYALFCLKLLNVGENKCSQNFTLLSHYASVNKFVTKNCLIGVGEFKRINGDIVVNQRDLREWWDHVYFLILLFAKWARYNSNQFLSGKL